jgi:hypothetical protein
VSQTIIGIALQTAQTSSLHWEDSRGFHPERFLEPEHPWFDSRFSRDNKDIFHPYSIGNRNCIAARYVPRSTSAIKAIVSPLVWLLSILQLDNWSYYLTSHLPRIHRFFQGEARLILARIIFSFDIQLTDHTDSDWMNQKAFLVFDMKPLYVKLRESTAPLA